MARRRRGLKKSSIVGALLRSAQASAQDAAKELDAGNCGEAADALLHAYAMRGEAEGYVRAQREMKGRPGRGISAIGDRRVGMLPRLKVKLRRLCSIRK